MLRLYLGKPLRTDVPADADQELVDRVAANWQSLLRGAPRRTSAADSGRNCGDVVADTQYGHLVGRLVRFDFGRSALKTREPVGDKIWRAFTVSAPLMITSEVLIYLLAVPLGVLCAVYRETWIDRLTSFSLFLLYSVPSFVAAMILLSLFAYGQVAEWFPMEGLHSDDADELAGAAYLADYAWHAFLPIVCLSIFSLAGLAMYTRTSMLDVLSQDYIRTARAIGVWKQDNPFQARAAQRPDSDRHAVCRFSAGPVRRQRAGRSAVRHSGHGAAFVGLDRAEGLSDADGAGLHRRHFDAGEHPDLGLAVRAGRSADQLRGAGGET